MYNKTTQKACEAYIAINRSRLKAYPENRYYLKDKTNFEIELFNPHQVNALAKIKFNGEYISTAGLVLKPGQRVFLSRYIDTNNSLLFETYEVENTHESLDAIAKNGKVEVEFYLEQTIQPNFNLGSTTWISTPNIYYTNNIGGSQLDNNWVYGSSSNHVNYSSNLSSPVAGSLSNSIETGKIEKGEKTDQGMQSTYGSYSSWMTNLVNIQLFPESIKPIEVSELRNYCTECGTRMKKSTWKFCPNCGNKI